MVLLSMEQNFKKPIVCHLSYPYMCLGPKTNSRGHTFPTRQQKRFVFDVPNHVTHTDEINQNHGR